MEKHNNTIINMEKIYFENQKKSSPVMACRETIQFLTSYSKSLWIFHQNNLEFEINLN
jgi:hypothetical protein